MLPSNDKLTECGVGGFSLIEVIVATAILSGGIIGLIGTFRMSASAAAHGEHANNVAALASNIIASAVAVSADQCESSEGSSGSYTWNLSYSQKQHNLMQATVVVSWLERRQTRNFHLAQVFLPANSSLRKQAE